MRLLHQVFCRAFSLSSLKHRMYRLGSRLESRKFHNRANEAGVSRLKVQCTLLNLQKCYGLGAVSVTCEAVMVPCLTSSRKQERLLEYYF